jgi:uncharacterized membrane protein YfcA
LPLGPPNGNFADMQSIDAKAGLFIALGFFVAYYLIVVGRALWRRSKTEDVRPTAPTVATGFLTAFLDTFGIGSFATTTSIFRQWRLVPDELLPGTLNLGHTLPTFVQAFIFTRLVPVDPTTLVLMIVAAVLGAWLGAGVFARWPRAWIQIGMGTALLIAATIFLGGALAFLPVGGSALALTGTKLAIGVTGNFVLGALMTLGIGLYGPCMILVALLGLTPTAAFPIMMGSCAFLMPVASARFVKLNWYHARAVIGLALGAVPAVLVAVYIVKSLPIAAVRWVVIVVVVYTAIGLLRSAQRELATAKPEAAT